ncbi:MAG: hypothetical protein V1903_13845 [Bacteroidota bacterium]
MMIIFIIDLVFLCKYHLPAAFRKIKVSGMYEINDEMQWRRMNRIHAEKYYSVIMMSGVFGPVVPDDQD